MKCLELARDMSVLGAETIVATPRDQLAFEEGQAPAAHANRWQNLRQRMLDHERDRDVIGRHLMSCGLGRWDYWLVAVATAAERYPEAAAALSIVGEDTQLQLPTPVAFAQLMQWSLGAVFAEALQAALGGGRAGDLGLIEPIASSPGRPSSSQPLRITPAELPGLLGDSESVLVHPACGDRIAPSDQLAFPDSLVNLATALLTESRLLVLRCASPRAGLQMSLDVAGRLQCPVHHFDASHALPSPATVRRVYDALPVIDLTNRSTLNGESRLTDDARTMLLEIRTSVRHCLALVGDQTELTGFVVLPIPGLRREHARIIWSQAGPGRQTAQELANRFIVSLPEARAAVARADRMAGSNGQKTALERIAREVLDDGARRIGRLATRIHSPARLDDLVVPSDLMAQLEEIVGWHRATQRVFGEMALGRHTPLGRGLTALFSGPPGVGKTFGALCLANELGLNLYRIDLSQIVSKYIGETEKALSRIFDEAEAGHGVLLFDEADALFGKRSEVKDAHDRYANIEVGYLLQRIEAFEGVAILATNLRSNMDAAFTRRMRFLLEFPMPDETMRRRLWEQALPDERFRSRDLDLAPFVGRFRLSGGCIQNICLAGAHLAAATPAGQITPAILVHAAYRELEKIGESRARSSFGPLARYLPQDIE